MQDIDWSKAAISTNPYVGIEPTVMMIQCPEPGLGFAGTLRGAPTTNISFVGMDQARVIPAAGWTIQEVQGAVRDDGVTDEVTFTVTVRRIKP